MPKKRKIRFKASDWKTDFDGTLGRWLARYLKRKLDELWVQYPPRGAAKDAAEAGGCRVCGRIVPRADLDVDHIKPKGRVPKTVDGWSDYLLNYFCNPTNLQGICKDPCHKEKTARDRKNAK